MGLTTMRNFFRDCGILVKAGIPLTEALEKCMRIPYLENFQSTLMGIIRAKRRGETLVSILRKLRIPEYFLVILKAGDEWVNLGDKMITLSEYIGKKISERGQNTEEFPESPKLMNEMIAVRFLDDNECNSLFKKMDENTLILMLNEADEKMREIIVKHISKMDRHQLEEKCFAVGNGTIEQILEIRTKIVEVFENNCGQTPEMLPSDSFLNPEMLLVETD